MKTFNNCAAQGDLLIQRVREIPAGYAKQESKQRHIVAHSETGHHHVMDAATSDYYVSDEDVMVAFVDVKEPTPIEHLRSFDTHEPILFPVGLFKLTRQREYVPEGWRQVED